MLLQRCDSHQAPRSVMDAVQELLVGEAVCPLTCPTLSLQEQGPNIPRSVSAAAPRGRCDSQQLAHVGSDDLQVHAAFFSLLIKCICCTTLRFI